MPIKKLVMVRRKPGLTPEQFRDGYENSHSRIAVRLFGHLWLAYTRNYVLTGYNFTSDEGNADVVGFDAISEFILPDQAALDEMNRISMENMEMIKEDEAKWFDQSRCWIMSCETFVEEGLEGAKQAA